MKILCFETSGDFCSVALFDGKKLVQSAHEDVGYGHAGALICMVRDVMDRAKIKIADLQVVAASTGPGSFTGIRVGLAAAQGLALAANLQMAGVTVFDVYGAQIQKAGASGDVGVLVVSRRHDFYGCVYDAAGQVKTPPRVVAAADLPEFLAGATMIVGDDALRARSLGVHVPVAPDFILNAVQVGQAVIDLGLPFGDLIPFYLRGADVTLPKAG